MSSLIHRTKIIYGVVPALAFGCFLFSHSDYAQCPQVCDNNLNTAFGVAALPSVNGGTANTAMGTDALASTSTGSYNTAVGTGTLLNNTVDGNTAVGGEAMERNTTGLRNVAVGVNVLGFNTTGNDNTATGYEALVNADADENTATGSLALGSDTSGAANTATGFQALFSNISGYTNTAAGVNVLYSNRTGYYNTASGVSALFFNVCGHDNLADGYKALLHNTGSNNIGLGSNAGGNLTTGSNNIDIGANVLGNAGEANTIRIGKQGTQRSTFIAGIYPTAVTGSTVVINSNGKLGVAASSARFKEQIKPMDNASEAILALQPVTFRYKKEIDPERTRQFGLVAEDVDKIDPELVVHNEQGKPYTVRYEAVNAMLLSEFLKGHRTVQELKANAAKQETNIAQQQKQIEALTAGLQKVSAQLELNKRAPKTVLNNR